jgi:hypothetical protein
MVSLISGEFSAVPELDLLAPLILSAADFFGDFWLSPTPWLSPHNKVIILHPTPPNRALEIKDLNSRDSSVKW